MLKNFLIDFALWMAERRGSQAESYHESSAWWADLSQSLEDGVPFCEVRARREVKQ